MLQKFPFYNFLTFKNNETPNFEDCCGKCGNVPLPVCFGTDLAFSLIINGLFYNIETDGGIDYCTPDGTFIRMADTSKIEFNDINTFAQLGDDLSQIFAPGDCFRLKVIDSSGDYNHFSPLFIYIGCDTENTLLFEYSDNNEPDKHFKIRLYSLLEKQQVKTDKSEYKSINGEVISLSKERRKTYNLSFHFYPDHIHDSIREMLMFPNILIDEVPMFESGDYEIDWDNPNENGNHRADTKVSEQDTLQFRIC